MSIAEERHQEIDLAAQMAEIGRAARGAARELARATTAAKNQALSAQATALRDRAAEILDANGQDMAAAEKGSVCDTDSSGDLWCVAVRQDGSYSAVATYKSTDGGLTWELKGLEATQTIGRIVVHPTKPDLVYVAALGHIWGPNKERGLYRTKDGGDTWELVKFISDKAGFVDISMDPTNPNVLFASSWERVRGPYFLKSGGPGSALWKTMDGGVMRRR